MIQRTKDIQLVLDVLQDEVTGNSGAALEKLAPDYSMTWVYLGKEALFPRTKKAFQKDLEEVYRVKGRDYDVRNIAEGDGVVMVELVESYPDPKTGRVFRTPLVIVLEVRDGRIYRGRHYCDPDLSHLFLSKDQIERIFL